MVQEAVSIVSITDKAAEKARALLKDRGGEDAGPRAPQGGCPARLRRSLDEARVRELHPERGEELCVRLELPDRRGRRPREELLVTAVSSSQPRPRDARGLFLVSGCALVARPP